MEKYNLSDCSIIIPAHIDFPQRLEHLNFLVHYFTRFFINYELIIVEQGKEPKIKIPNLEGIHIEFLESEDGFSTSIISNVGASLVKTPYFCKCDTDAAIHPKAIFDAFEVLKSSPRASLVVPYNGISFTLKDFLREKLMRSYDFNILPLVNLKESTCINTPDISLKSNDSKGLIHHFRTSVFKKLGGYNEEFIGWGYEDNEILTRFKNLGHPKVVLEGYNAFHLDHPRMEVSQFYLLQNLYKLHLVEHMPAEQLTDYIKSWSRYKNGVSHGG